MRTGRDDHKTYLVRTTVKLLSLDKMLLKNRRKPAEVNKSHIIEMYNSVESLGSQAVTADSHQYSLIAHSQPHPEEQALLSDLSSSVEEFSDASDKYIFYRVVERDERLISTRPDGI